MRAVAADPTAALSQMSCEQHPDLDRLAALVAGAPPIEVHYGIEQPEEQGLLAADAELARVEERWRVVFEQVKPLVTATQHGDENVWAHSEAWLAFLQREPLAWQSFDVLDDLAMAVDALPVMRPDGALRPLLARGVALL